MKKIAVICTALLLAGCIEQAPAKNIQRIKTYQLNAYNEIAEVCIDGVVYLLYQPYKGGGITPKINANYDVYICNP
ncbi:hypothetical protein L5B71_08545 [Avibacterium sp. 21-586]|uniref:hypothetical protein n=1 Tax=Avibacterium sp. 21-586 TaxID=2911534 RepID=UPI002247AC17|nr:hypothetical protein [Avibacterium sp. 21-586]MCW9710883.1 hypothetical protein [Avibacterium sp. 21-586]